MRLNNWRFRTKIVMFLKDSYFVGHFCLPVSGSTDLIESGSNTDLDPKHCPEVAKIHWSQQFIWKRSALGTKLSKNTHGLYISWNVQCKCKWASSHFTYHFLMIQFNLWTKLWLKMLGKDPSSELAKKSRKPKIETEWSSTIVTILSKSIREKTACGN